MGKVKETISAIFVVLTSLLIPLLPVGIIVAVGFIFDKTDNVYVRIVAVILLISIFNFLFSNKAFKGWLSVIFLAASAGFLIAWLITLFQNEPFANRLYLFLITVIGILDCMFFAIIWDNTCEHCGSYGIEYRSYHVSTSSGAYADGYSKVASYCKNCNKPQSSFQYFTKYR